MSESIKKNSITLGEFLYYLFFGSLLFAKGIGLYDGQTVFKLFLVFAVLCFGFKMLITAHTVREWVMIGFLLILGAVTYLVSGEKGALLYIMMITGLKNVPVKRVFYVGLVTWAVSFGGLFLLNATHLADSAFKVHDKMGMGTIRWSLGYAHPNVLHVSYLILTIFIVYALGKRFNWKWLLGLMIGNLYVFLYSVSYTGLLTVIFYLALNLYWHFRKKLAKPESFLIQLCMPVFVLFSLLAPVVLTGKAFDLFNKITNTRMELSQRFLTTVPHTLFGVRIAEYITDRVTMDSSYVFAYITYGIVLFILIIAGYFWIIRKYCREQKGTELSILLSTLLAGITEPFLFNTSFKNVGLLFFGEILFKDNQKKKIGFLTGLNQSREISLPQTAKWNRFFARIKQNRTKIVIALISGFLSGVLLYGAVINGSGTAVFFGGSNTQELIEQLYTGQSSGAAGKILQYIAASDGDLALTREVIVLEWTRGIVTGGILLAALFAGILCVKIYFAKQGQNKERQQGKR